MTSLSLLLANAYPTLDNVAILLRINHTHTIQELIVFSNDNLNELRKIITMSYICILSQSKLTIYRQLHINYFNWNV